MNDVRCKKTNQNEQLYEKDITIDVMLDADHDGFSTEIRGWRHLDVEEIP